MPTWLTNTSHKLKWLSSLSPFHQLEHMALTLQIPLLNFNIGARHNYCPTVDTVMGMGVHDMQHTRASPRQSHTMCTDIHLPFRDQFDKWQQTNKVLAPSSPSLATDTKRLATDKQSNGNRQMKGGSVISNFFFLFTECLATVKQTVWQQTKQTNTVILCIGRWVWLFITCSTPSWP